MTTQEILNEKIEMESMGWTYEKTDKNGTRYYTTCKYPKCDGLENDKRLRHCRRYRNHN